MSWRQDVSVAFLLALPRLASPRLGDLPARVRFLQGFDQTQGLHSIEIGDIRIHVRQIDRRLAPCGYGLGAVSRYRCAVHSADFQVYGRSLKA